LVVTWSKIGAVRKVAKQLPVEIFQPAVLKWKQLNAYARCHGGAPFVLNDPMQFF
jgi:hypothetical protein